MNRTVDGDVGRPEHAVRSGNPGRDDEPAEHHGASLAGRGLLGRHVQHDGAARRQWFALGVLHHEIIDQGDAEIEALGGAGGGWIQFPAGRQHLLRHGVGDLEGQDGADAEVGGGELERILGERRRSGKHQHCEQQPAHFLSSLFERRDDITGSKEGSVRRSTRWQVSAGPLGLTRRQSVPGCGLPRAGVPALFSSARPNL